MERKEVEHEYIQLLWFLIDFFLNDKLFYFGMVDIQMEKKFFLFQVLNKTLYHYKKYFQKKKSLKYCEKKY